MTYVSKLMLCHKYIHLGIPAIAFSEYGLAGQRSLHGIRLRPGGAKGTATLK